MPMLKMFNLFLVHLKSLNLYLIFQFINMERELNHNLIYLLMVFINLKKVIFESIHTQTIFNYLVINL